MDKALTARKSTADFIARYGKPDRYFIRSPEYMETVYESLREKMEYGSVAMEREYVLNRETGKIELYFEKPEYDALPEDQKKELNRFFNWSRTSKAWVSKASKNLYFPRKIAIQLGFTKERREGERRSFAEQIERKQERAEARAERYSGYADNAEKRSEQLQSGLNTHHGDIAFFTQPFNNTSGGRRFANYVKRLNTQFERGIEEYRKSEYFREKAFTASKTAEMPELKDKAFLNRRIEERKKSVHKVLKSLKFYGNLLDKLDADEPLEGFYRDKSHEEIQGYFDRQQERLETLIDEQSFYENCLEELGGITYSQENIKPGYVVRIRGYVTKVIKANPKTVYTKDDMSNIILTYPYAEIQEIVEATGETPLESKESHPYKVGQILGRYNITGSYLLNAFQIVKQTEKTITIREIKVDSNCTPLPDHFIGEPTRKKPFVNSYTGKWQVADARNWVLYLIQPKETEKECA